MKQVKCPDCGTEYPASLKACPECGCPNDHQLSADAQANERQTNEAQADDRQEGATLQIEPQQETEYLGITHGSFNENTPYSPFSPDNYFFRDPWPLNVYPIGELERRHPFWGWLFGPWHLTCKEECYREQYDVLNNLFYAFNLIFKAIIYPVLWTFFKVWVILLLFIVAAFAISRLSPGAYTAGLIIGILNAVLYIFVVFVYIFGIGKSLHRYWPQFHKVWRRLSKRFVKSMK